MNRSLITYAAVASIALPVVITGLAAPASATETIKVNCAHHSLQAAINEAHSGATVAVKGHGVGAFTIAKNLTIKGNPTATLDAAHQRAVVTIKGKRRVTLASLTITRGRAADGGGIDVAAKGLLTLKHVTVSHNAAIAGVGGGIAAVGGAVVRISHSKIVDNTASVPATSSNLLVRGGGIATTGKTTISSSTLAGNVAQGRGAANGTANGGAIYATSALIIERSTLAKNTAESSAAVANSANGAAVAWLPAGRGGLAINGVTVSQNQASAHGLDVATAAGGALYLAPAAGSHGAAKVSSSTFIANQVTANSVGSSASGRGGALDASGLRSALTIDTSTFRGNGVGGSASEGDVSVSGGGIATSGSGAVGVDRSTIDSNQVVVDAGGGAVGAFGAGLYLGGAATDEVINSTISRNDVTASGLGGSATLDLGGGGIAAYDKKLRVHFGTIVGNKAVSDSPGGGGGILVATISATRIDGSILAANSAVHGTQCAGTITSGGYNVYTGLSGCTWTARSGDKLTSNPKLGAIGAHGGPTPTIPLESGSSAINIAPKVDCDGLTTDQRGIKRPQGKKCDAGAYERTS